MQTSVSCTFQWFSLGESTFAKYDGLSELDKVKVYAPTGREAQRPLW